jgi:hypothetical protein
MVLPIVGFLLGCRMDARWLVAAGVLIVAVANFWMSQMNLSISPWQVVWPRVVLKCHKRLALPKTRLDALDKCGYALSLVIICPMSRTAATLQLGWI